MLLFGVIVTLALSFGMLGHEQRSLQDDFERRALSRASAVQQGVANAIDALQLVNQAFVVNGSVSGERFDAFTQALRALYPYIQALGFERPVARDAASLPFRDEAARRTEDTGLTSASGLFAVDGQRQFKLLMAVNGGAAVPGSVAGRRLSMAGHTVVVLRAKEFFEKILASADPGANAGLDIRVYASPRADENELAYVHTSAPGAAGAASLGERPKLFSRNFDLAGSTWHLSIAAPATPFLAAHAAALFSLLMGLLASCAATAYVHATALRTRRIEQLVAQRTDELEKVNALLSVDIKARVQLEQALLGSEERAREFAELSSDLFWEQDEHLRYTTVSAELMGNDAVAAPFVYGVTRWEVPVDPDASDWAAHRALLEAHQPFRNFEFKTMAPSPSGDSTIVQWFSSSGKPLFDAGGHFKGYRGTSRDISDRKQAEAALEHSRQMLSNLAEHQESVREDERKRIARDIHDELGQNLMAHRLDVSMMATQFDSVAVSKERIHAALRQIDTTIKAVRSIINDLRPAVLDLGLHAAVEWQVTEFERRSGIACELHIDHDEFALDDKHATALFRILQESLSNILRHARARHVQIEMQRRDGGLCVRIADQGIGLPADWRRKANAFGLAGIEERIFALGGTFSIVSQPGQGTAISVSIPLDSSPATKPGATVQPA